MNMSLSTALLLASAAGLAGLAFGLAYFRVLRRTADILAAGRGWRAASGLVVARVAAVFAFLGMLTYFGVVPLLAGFSGFLVARSLALRSEGGAG